MNALAHITYTNACPPAYRNLSPKEECILRGKRLGTIERPGAVPETMIIYDRRIANARKDAVINAILAGNNTRKSLRHAMHFATWIDAIVETLVVSGKITTTRGKTSVTYEVQA